ncbi:MAG TPA: c-type cytochrome [Acidimicrobiia bacterium]|nr:c-type cytochrome [Acidimicrobiia bacterium]
MPTDHVRLWLTVALALVLAIATVSYYSRPSSDSVGVQSPGELLFLSKGCTGCHSIQGLATTGQIGPDLTSVGEVAGERVQGLSAEEYLSQSLATPQAFIVPGFEATTAGSMPDFDLTDGEVRALVDFLLEER